MISEIYSYISSNVNEYYLHLVILVGMYIILAQSFNLPFGLGRLFNLAHVATYAIGAYTTALLATDGGYSLWVCIPASMVVSALFALLIGAIAARLTSDYFAIGTLAFSSVVTALLINWKSLTRGVLGIPGIPRPEIGTIDFFTNLNFLILLWIFVILSLLMLWPLFRNSFGRTLKAQAEFEYAAQALGKNTGLVRNIAFVISSGFAGLAGSFFAYYLNYIDPSSFALNEMIFIVTIVVVGRPGSFWGNVFGTIFLVLLPEPLRFIEWLNERPSILGPMRQLLYAVILFTVVFINRRKLFPQQRNI